MGIPYPDKGVHVGHVDRSALRAGIGIESRGKGAAAQGSVEVDEQVASIIPVGTGPGQAQPLGIPTDVEVLRVLDGRGGLGVLLHAAVHADARAPAVHPAVVEGKLVVRRGQGHVVWCERRVHVDRTVGVHLAITVGEDAGDLHVHPLRLARDVLRAQRPGGRDDGGDVLGLRHRVHSPSHLVVGELGGRVAGLPGEGQRGRDLAQRRALRDDATGGHVAGHGQRDGVGLIQVHGDRLGDAGGPAGPVGGADRDGVLGVVRLLAQVPVVGPGVPLDRGRTPVAVHLHLHRIHAGGQVADLAGEAHPPVAEPLVPVEGRGPDVDRGRGRVHVDLDGIGRSHFAGAVGDPGVQVVHPFNGQPGQGPLGGGDVAGTGQVDGRADGVEAVVDGDVLDVVLGVGVTFDVDRCGAGQDRFVGGREDRRVQVRQAPGIRLRRHHLLRTAPVEVASLDVVGDRRRGRPGDGAALRVFVEARRVGEGLRVPGGDIRVEGAGHRRRRGRHLLAGALEVVAAGHAVVVAGAHVEVEVPRPAGVARLATEDRRSLDAADLLCGLHNGQVHLWGAGVYLARPDWPVAARGGVGDHVRGPQQELVEPIQPLGNGVGPGTGDDALSRRVQGGVGVEAVDFGGGQRPVVDGDLIQLAGEVVVVRGSTPPIPPLPANVEAAVRVRTHVGLEGDCCLAVHIQRAVAVFLDDHHDLIPLFGGEGGVGAGRLGVSVAEAGILDDELVAVAAAAVVKGQDGTTADAIVGRGDVDPGTKGEAVGVRDALGDEVRAQVVVHAVEAHGGAPDAGHPGGGAGVPLASSLVAGIAGEAGGPGRLLEVEDGHRVGEAGHGRRDEAQVQSAHARADDTGLRDAATDLQGSGDGAGDAGGGLDGIQRGPGRGGVHTEGDQGDHPRRVAHVVGGLHAEGVGARGIGGEQRVVHLPGVAVQGRFQERQRVGGRGRVRELDLHAGDAAAGTAGHGRIADGAFQAEEPGVVRLPHGAEDLAVGDGGGHLGWGVVHQERVRLRRGLPVAHVVGGAELEQVAPLAHGGREGGAPGRLPGGIHAARRRLPGVCGTAVGADAHLHQGDEGGGVVGGDQELHVPVGPVRLVGDEGGTRRFGVHRHLGVLPLLDPLGLVAEEVADLVRGEGTGVEGHVINAAVGREALGIPWSGTDDQVEGVRLDGVRADVHTSHRLAVDVGDELVALLPGEGQVGPVAGAHPPPLAPVAGPGRVPDLGVELAVLDAQHEAIADGGLAHQLLVGIGVGELHPHGQGHLVVGVQGIAVGHADVVVHAVKLGGQAQLPLGTGFGAVDAAAGAVVAVAGGVGEGRGAGGLVQQEEHLRRPAVEGLHVRRAEGPAEDPDVVQVAVQRLRVAAEAELVAEADQGPGDVLAGHLNAVDVEAHGGAVVGPDHVVPDAGLQGEPGPQVVEDVIVRADVEVEVAVLVAQHRLLVASERDEAHDAIGQAVEAHPGGDGEFLQVLNAGLVDQHVVVRAVEAQGHLIPAGHTGGGAGGARGTDAVAAAQHVGEGGGAGGVVQGQVEDGLPGVVEVLHLGGGEGTAVDAHLINAPAEADAVRRVGPGDLCGHTGIRVLERLHVLWHGCGEDVEAPRPEGR